MLVKQFFEVSFRDTFYRAIKQIYYEFPYYRNIDHLASYVGLVPSTHSSDTTVLVGGVTRRHCTHLRSTLIECAWVAIRNDEALLCAYNKLTKHMKKTAAIIRIAKKLLNRIRFVWKSKTEYVKGIVAIELV